MCFFVCTDYLQNALNLVDPYYEPLYEKVHIYVKNCTAAELQNGSTGRMVDHGHTYTLMGLTQACPNKQRHNLVISLYIVNTLVTLWSQPCYNFNCATLLFCMGNALSAIHFTVKGI